MSFLSDYLGPIFLLSVGLSSVIGAWSAHLKANRIFRLRGLENLDEEETAVAKAFIAAGFAGIVWYESTDLDEAVIWVAIPFGVYKFVQLILTPIIGSQLSVPVDGREETKVDNG